MPENTPYYNAVSPGGGWYDGIYFPFNDVTDGPNMGDAGGCNGGTGGGGKCSKAVGSPLVGDPINPATGNKTIEETDNLTDMNLVFRRFYNSAIGVQPGSMGAHWRHTFDRKLQKTIVSGFPNFDGTFVATRPDGKFEVFTKNAVGTWFTGSDSADTLTDLVVDGELTGYALRVAALRATEYYSLDGLLQSVENDAGQVTSLTYSTASSPSVPKAGLLLAVTAPSGRQLGFAYDASARLIRVTLPDDGVLNYSYDAVGNLISVEYPDGNSKTYAYNEADLTGGANLPAALTGVIDEAGQRFENTAYKSNGWAISTGFANGAGVVNINYNGNGTSDITFPSGARPRQDYAKVKGHALSQGLSQACGSCDDAFQTRTYDANARPASYTDFEGIVTATTYDANGLLTMKVEAQGRDEERITETTWDAALRVPLLTTIKDKSGAVLKKQGWAYNAGGLTTATCNIDPVAAPSYTCSPAGEAPSGVRRTIATYCTAIDSVNCPLLGLMLTTDGPRTDVSDVTSYTYYVTTDESGCATVGGTCHRSGDLKSITDGAGLTITYMSYDKAGRVTRMKNPSGILTDYTYTPRGWLATKTARADAAGVPSSSDDITTIAYDPTGAVSAIQDPDGVTTKYTYDAAHRLTDITDAGGRKIHYTLDASGNRTGESVIAEDGTVVTSTTRTFNALDQLTSVVDGLGRRVFSASGAGSYDAAGNLVMSQDGRGSTSRRSIDGLNRLVSTVRDYQGTSTSTQNSQWVANLDVLGHLIGFSDADGLTTTYDTDAFGNVTGIHSPDTGSATFGFDITGNQVAATDSSGAGAIATYDADNRILTTSYADDALNIQYKYDEADSITGCVRNAAKGRLTRIIELNGTSTFCYDRQGNVVSHKRTAGGETRITTYDWTGANRLKSLTTPNGTVIAYTRNAMGQITNVKVTPAGGASTTVASNVTYNAFGALASYTLGNGQMVSRTYDASGALIAVASPAFALHVQRDAMGNITAVTDPDGQAPLETYSYDALGRITAVKDEDQAVVESYSYSKNGDRLTKEAPGLLTGTYAYQTGTHHLTGVGAASREVDARGNTVSRTLAGSTYKFIYNQRNRLSSVQKDGATVASYLLNALGQRVQKSVGGIATQFDYDEQGRLISEAKDNASRDYVWLDHVPVGLVDRINGVTAVSFLHADGLGSPRAVTDANGVTQWSWPYVSNPFGEKSPVSNSGYVLNLRFPGQYFDAESGLSYNQNRDYEAASGRYIQSDPLGVRGGLNTYGYAYSNPGTYFDPSGLAACRRIVSIKGATHEELIGSTLLSANWELRNVHVEPLLSSGGISILTGAVSYFGLATGALGAKSIVDCSATYVQRFEDTYELSQNTYYVDLCFDEDACGRKAPYTESGVDTDTRREVRGRLNDVSNLEVTLKSWFAESACLDWLRTLQ